jgi:polysaccharide export outer membrane protein
MRLTTRNVSIWGGVTLAALVLSAVVPAAQVITQRPGVPAGVETKLKPPPPPPVPLGYVIGPDDVLTVFVRDDKDMSGDFVVRPDGKIAIPLLNDIQAAGLTPAQLREVIATAADQFVKNPTVTIIVKLIQSRFVYITGAVNRPGRYPLGGTMTVLQLIATAGGLHEFADKENIVVNRGTETFRVNYNELSKPNNRNLKQNLELKPGDVVMVSGG